MAEEAVREKSEAIKKDLDEGLKALLDHVAVELAEEYVRLIEEAADTETATRVDNPEMTLRGGSK